MTRFIKRRTDPPITTKPEVFEAMKKLIKRENKILSKVRKRAKLEKVALSDIYEKLLLFAMRESIRQLLKDIDNKVFLPKK